MDDMINMQRKITIPKLDRRLYLAAFQRLDRDAMDSCTGPIDTAWIAVYDAVSSGAARVAWWDAKPAEDGAFMRYALHRSTKYAGCLQMSAMEIKNGNMIPTSDSQHDSADSFLRRGGLPSGITVYLS